MGRTIVTIILAAAALSGCVSPYTRLEQNDLRWYAEDRYRFAGEMPASTRDEAFHKIQAYWETMETIRRVEDSSAQFTLDAQAMDRDAARRRVRERIKQTEKNSDITAADYCGRMCAWTTTIPVKIALTPVDALLIGLESPVTNVEW